MEHFPTDPLAFPIITITTLIHHAPWKILLSNLVSLCFPLRYGPYVITLSLLTNWGFPIPSTPYNTVVAPWTDVEMNVGVVCLILLLINITLRCTFPHYPAACQSDPPCNERHLEISLQHQQRQRGIRRESYRFRWPAFSQRVVHCTLCEGN